MPLWFCPIWCRFRLSATDLVSFYSLSIFLALYIIKTLWFMQIIEKSRFTGFYLCVPLCFTLCSFVVKQLTINHKGAQRILKGTQRTFSIFPLVHRDSIGTGLIVVTVILYKGLLSSELFSHCQLQGFCLQTVPCIFCSCQLSQLYSYPPAFPIVSEVLHHSQTGLWY